MTVGKLGWLWVEMLAAYLVLLSAVHLVAWKAVMLEETEAVERAVERVDWSVGLTVDQMVS